MTTRRETALAELRREIDPLKPGTPEYAAAFERFNAETMPRVHAEDLAEERERDAALLTRLQAQALRSQREGEAQALVAPIAYPETIPALLPFAVERVHVEPTDDGEGRVTYRDANGNPTTREALQAELAARPSLARLVKGASAEEKAAHARRVALALGEKPARTNGQGKR